MFLGRQIHGSAQRCQGEEHPTSNNIEWDMQNNGRWSNTRILSYRVCLALHAILGAALSQPFDMPFSANKTTIGILDHRQPLTGSGGATEPAATRRGTSRAKSEP